MKVSLEEAVVRLRKDFQFSIVAMLGCLVVLVLAPFAIYRFLQGDWFVFALDITASLFGLFVVLYAFISNNSERAALALACFATACLAVSSFINPALTPYWMYCLILFNFSLVRPNSALILVAIGFVSVFSRDSVFVDVTVRTTYTVTAISTTIFAYIFALRTEYQNRTLEKLARTDPLTGASNRRAFSESVELAIKSVSRPAVSPVTMVLIDVDHFKKVNDDFGHEVGDRVLIELVELINNNIRPSDKLFRIGGEEFYLMMNYTDEESAITASNKLCELVRGVDFISGHRITVSIGASQINIQDSVGSWMKRCDSALYAAKSQGRDQVVYSKALVGA